MPPEISRVIWLSGIEADNSAPQYLVSSQHPRGILDDAMCSAFKVKIGDLGGGLIFFSMPKKYGLLTISTAFRTIQYDFSSVTPVALRVSKLLLQQS